MAKTVTSIPPGIETKATYKPITLRKNKQKENPQSPQQLKKEVTQAKVNSWNSVVSTVKEQTPISQFELKIPGINLKLDLNRINPREEEDGAIRLAAYLEIIQDRFRLLHKDFMSSPNLDSTEDKDQLLQQLSDLQRSLPVEKITQSLKNLKELRNTIAESIEFVDKATRGKKELYPLLSKLNKATIEINIAILYLQLKKAEDAIKGKLNLPDDKRFQTNTAIMCLEGAKETAINLAWEYGFRAERKLASETIEKEIRVSKTETLDEEGNIISATYTINGFDIKVSAGEEDLTKISLRQRVWINAHTTLDEIKQLIEKGERGLARKKIDLLTSIYDPNRSTYGTFDERQPKYEEHLREINEALHALKVVVTEVKEDQVFNEGVLDKISGTIDDMKKMIKYPKQSVWKEFNYSGFDKVFRGKLHTLISIENDYRILHRNMAYLNHFARIIQKAETRKKAHDERVRKKIVEVTAPYKSFLAKKRKELITKRVQELEIWSWRGFVYEKQHSTELLEEALNSLAQDEYRKAKNTIDTVTQHIRNRMSELVDIANAVKDKAFKVFLEYRDCDIKDKTDTIIKLVGSRDFGEALKEISEIRGRYFTQGTSEYGYQRARKLLDTIETEIRSAETRKRYNKLKDADLEKIVSELQKLKEDIDKKDLFRIPVVIVKGDNHPVTLFVEPGKAFNQMIILLKEELKKLNVSFTPNQFFVKIDGNWLTRNQRASYPLPDNRPVIIVTQKPGKKL